MRGRTARVKIFVGTFLPAARASVTVQVRFVPCIQRTPIAFTNQSATRDTRHATRDRTALITTLSFHSTFGPLVRSLCPYERARLLTACRTGSSTSTRVRAPRSRMWAAHSSPSGQGRSQGQPYPRVRWAQESSPAPKGSLLGRQDTRPDSQRDRLSPACSQKTGLQRCWTRILRRLARSHTHPFRLPERQRRCRRQRRCQRRRQRRLQVLRCWRTPRWVPPFQGSTPGRTRREHPHRWGHRRARSQATQGHLFPGTPRSPALARTCSARPDRTRARNPPWVPLPKGARIPGSPGSQMTPASSLRASWRKQRPPATCGRGH